MLHQPIVEVILVGNFVDMDDWAEYLYEALTDLGYVPEEELIYLILDLSIEFLKQQQVIDYTIEFE